MNYSPAFAVCVRWRWLAVMVHVATAAPDESSR
jgi:hypothetical protein